MTGADASDPEWQAAEASLELLLAELRNRVEVFEIRNDGDSEAEVVINGLAAHVLSKPAAPPA